jgi:ABC-type lipoprotein release transport system permease subunit
VQAINADLAIVDLRTMDQILDTCAAQRRLPAATLTGAAVCAVLLTAGFAALYLPARWASSLDPAHTLRGE